LIFFVENIFEKNELYILYEEVSILNYLLKFFIKNEKKKILKINYENKFFRKTFKNKL
jgi:hypothetical protein